MIGLAVISWIAWAVVYFGSDDDAPYPLMLGWFIVNLVLTSSAAA